MTPRWPPGEQSAPVWPGRTGCSSSLGDGRPRTAAHPRRTRRAGGRRRLGRRDRWLNTDSTRARGRRRSTMPEHYDVIIIGTRAGGGTLAHTLAPVRQADPAPRAGRLPAAGDGQLESRRRVRRRQVHLQGHLVRRRRQGVPAAGPLLRGRRHQAVRRRPVPAPAAGLRRAAARRRPLARLAADLRGIRALVHQGGVALPGPRHAGEDPTEGPWSQAVSVAGGVARAADPAAGRRPHRRRLPPVPGPLRDPARRGATGPRARASAARGAMAIPAWCTRNPTPKSWLSARYSTSRT